MNLSELLSVAKAWMAADPDPHTRAQTQEMIAAEDVEALGEHFGQRLQFGTAGIRGPLGPGPGAMNRLLIRQVTAGLADYLLATVPEAAQRGVVIGFDARHGSRIFASDAASVLAARGIAVWLYEAEVPTPQLAHAVVALSCAAGVMVTASHNPAPDNGYKVYWSQGAQIIPPHDQGISEAIAVAELGPLEEEAVLRARGWVATPEEWVLDDYVESVLALRVRPQVPGARLVYTAMHGVGHALIQRVFASTPHQLIGVPEQVLPDPDFPTAPKPNPEEPGALDLALGLAREQKAHAIIANDPDADRLAVALPVGGEWRVLTGNEIGVLLAAYLLEHGEPEPHRMLATTVVSTSLLRKLAEEHGLDYAETLTGFKWIAAAALSHSGPFVMGFEEALGYCVGEVVRDKDGVSAALLFADLVSDYAAQGSSPLALLERTYRRHGVHLTAQRSIVLPGTSGRARMEALMEALRAAPPAGLAGLSVRQVRDLRSGEALDMATGRTRPIDLPSSNVLAYDLEGGSRVVMRPSGTEPKIKFYFQAVLPMEEDEGLHAAETRTGALLASLVEDFMSRVKV